MKISVLGCGRWGAFLARSLANGCHESNTKNQITLWGREQSANMKALVKEKQNKYPAEYHMYEVYDDINLETDLAKALDADVVLVAISAQNFREFAKQIVACNANRESEKVDKQKFMLCMKGLEESTGKSMTEVAIESGIPKNNLAVLWGPGHVQDIERGNEALMAIDAYEYALAEELKNSLKFKNISFFEGNNVVGAEITSAAKNMYGVGAGMLEALNLGNKKFLLMEAGKLETSGLIKKMGGNYNYPYFYTGNGDFEVTLFSENSNNFRWGEAFIKSEGDAETMKKMKTAEGVASLNAFAKLSKDFDVQLPVAEAIHDIVYESAPAETLLDAIEKSGMYEKWGDAFADGELFCP